MLLDNLLIHCVSLSWKFTKYPKKVQRWSVGPTDPYNLKVCLDRNSVPGRLVLLISLTSLLSII
jgi:hypothetical protein